MTGRVVDHSLGNVWTPVEAVVAAARACGVYLMVWTPDSLSEHREVLVAVSPDRAWAISRSRDILGWVAVQLAPDGTDLPGTRVRLGAADATGAGLIETLLTADLLPEAHT